MHTKPPLVTGRPKKLQYKLGRSWQVVLLLFAYRSLGLNNLITCKKMLTCNKVEEMRNRSNGRKLLKPITFQGERC